MKNEIIKGKPANWIVISAKPQENYTIVITFLSGEKRIYNALPLLEKSLYQPLKNLNIFLSCKVEGGSIVWNDELDIAPEHLYECSKPI